MRTRAFHRVAGPALTALGFAIALADYTAGAASSVPVPTVSGPIAAKPAGDPGRDYPFYAAVVDLHARGYVEEEFFIEGTASRYTTPAQATGSIVETGHPYKTRVVVRRPATAARFNGTAVIEWNNVTAGHDLDIDWFQTHDHLMRSGYAWVGVTPQRIGVEAIKVWNAKRYGTLDVTDGGKVTNDDLSYDIFAQAGQAVRAGTNNLMGGLRVQHVFATGHSQSAGRLGTYVNSVHPIARVFDAVILHGGGGRVRTDLDIPVWKLLSETDVQNQAVNRQPDTNLFRTWEVAGDSHVDLQFMSYSRQLSSRDGSPVAPGFSPAGARSSQGSGSTSSPTNAGLATTPARGAGGSPCERPPYSHVPFYQVFDAALDHLVRWVKDGTPPPVAPPIDVVSAGPPAVMARDEAGNALGGIRLAQHAVPTAVNTGVNTGPGFCRLYGSYEPFAPEKLAALYPTHAAYVAKVKDVTARNLSAGYILKPEADATIAEAEKVTIGR
jgi:alpha/beta hydrolase family protein